MKRQDILYRILITIFAAIVLAVFTIPQKILDNYEMLFLWILMPLLGFLWIQAFIDGMRDN